MVAVWLLLLFWFVLLCFFVVVWFVFRFRVNLRLERKEIRPWFMSRKGNKRGNEGLERTVKTRYFPSGQRPGSPLRRQAARVGALNKTSHSHPSRLQNVIDVIFPYLWYGQIISNPVDVSFL